MRCRPVTALVGRALLYWWPDDGGWQRDTVARLCPFRVPHVVACTRQTRTSAFCGTAYTLLTRLATPPPAASGPSRSR